MEREVRVETGYLDDAETVIVAFGSPARFVKHAIEQLRAGGHAIGYIRPITLWPFPYSVVREAAGTARALGSFEMSSGQLVDDVRIGAAGLAPVTHLGGVSTDHSGFGVGRLLDVDEVTTRILALHEGRPQPEVPGYEEFAYALTAHQEEAAP
jgi:2-oxoglutarate ferredoxin oxidoreductase subunit alpha